MTGSDFTAPDLTPELDPAVRQAAAAYIREQYPDDADLLLDMLGLTEGTTS